MPRTVFGNLGVHVIQFPSGRFGFVGSLPSTLGVPLVGTAADVMAGRAAIKFPVFDTKQEALDHAARCGVAVVRA